MGMLSEFPNTKVKTFDKEWDQRQSGLIESRMKEFEKLSYDLLPIRQVYDSRLNQVMLPNDYSINDIFRQDLIIDLPLFRYSNIQDSTENTRHNLPDSFRQVQTHNRNSQKWHKP